MWKRLLRAKKVLARKGDLKKTTGIKKYGDLVTVQELVREIGRSLDKIRALAPEMEMFSIDTPRHSFTILSRDREQKKLT